MAIYGIGADWSGENKVDEFVRDEKACIGWWIDDAPSLYKILKQMKIGDIIYVKSSPPGRLIIKAIGFVTNDEPFSYDEEAKEHGIYNCIKVKWIWLGEEDLGKIDDKYNVRNNTIYEEFNPEIQTKIVKMILDKLYS
ncbi:MAG TPA: hypothetical protein ENG63_08600 [Candidatus Desulfofervidus auxilii]|uniref:EVE domain-containing protein n=1 Tax=Desulfofervidus auxilii TaxID=1621989 RepID=A0A7C0Y5G6_DESA2